MKIEIRRLECTTLFTRGELYIDDHFECFTLEDPITLTKVYGESCIPFGKYVIGFKEALTPKTKKYLERFPEFFSKHLEIKDVEGFTDTYLHIGNNVEDTLGCVLLGMGKGSTSSNLITNSTTAFTQFYKKVSQALLEGVEVTLEITGE